MTGRVSTVRWLARGERDLPTGTGWLSAAEAEYCARLRFTKRRTEFLVARWAAKQAMAGLPGCAGDPSRLEVRRHPTGAPEAHADGRRLDVGTSLSDRTSWAVCLLGLGPGMVGCDLELVEPRSAAFVADYFTPAERRYIGSCDLRANLLWSAKESALKVLGTGLRRDTRSVEVTVHGRGAGWSPLVVRAAGAGEFPGWWIRHGDFLLTVAATVPTAPPVGLDEVPALATAEPVHSWLAEPFTAPPPVGTSRAPARR